MDYLISSERTSPAPAVRARNVSVSACDLLLSHPQIDMFILAYALEVKIKVFRLFKFNSRDFTVCYPEESRREWPEMALLTENDHHYDIPVF